jgi:DNA-binding MarR family transcriptional regulator
LTSPKDCKLPFAPKLETMLDEFVRIVPEVDALAVETLLQLLYASRSIFSALEANFARHDLSNGKFSVLIMLLHHQDQGIQPSEVAKRLGVTRGTITGLLHGLERADLLRREAHPEDKRKQLLRLTDQGRELLARVLPDYGRRIADIMAGLDAEERRQLICLSSKLIAGIPALSEG